VPSSDSRLGKRGVESDRRSVASDYAVVRVAITAVCLLAFAFGCRGSSSAPTATTTDRALPSEALEFRAEGWTTDFTRREVPLSEFLSGGPPKDGIPPIDSPRFLRVDAVDFVRPEEPVIELIVKGEARAYPIQILIWHEIVNDTIAGVPVAVTFCPLCNTALVFERRVDGDVLDFGTTGKLRQSDLVMYDRQTESWWQQFGGDGLVGRYAGVDLERIPARIVAWGEFRRAHPEGLVLDRPRAHPVSRGSELLRPYGENPYEGYDDVNSSPLFPVANDDDRRLPPKERVVFIERAGDAVVVPYTVLERRRTVRVTVGGERLVVSFRSGPVSALDSRTIGEGRKVGAAEVMRDGRLVEFDEPFWFVVAAFRPDARVVR
jgi:Protein of unknown function (DUF3179)